MSAARLPLEIFAHICDIIPPMDLCSAILVNKACRQVVERSLYSFIYLDFFDAGQRLRSTRCLQTLSTSTSAAAAVRHLELRGLGLLEPLTQAVFIAAMTLTVNLSSLDLLCIISNNSVVFPEALTRASSFLPRLEALNVDDSELILLLAPGRPCTSVRIQETIQEDSLGDIVDALSRAAVPIQHLQLKVATSGEHGILASFLPIPHSFRSLISVGIQFVLPSPSLTWELFVDLLCTMAASLSPINSLRAVSLVTIPDPVIPPSEISALTRRVADMIVGEYLPQLHRIEVRWSGWLTQIGVDEWVPIPQSKLLRRGWHYRQANRGCSTAH